MAIQIYNETPTMTLSKKDSSINITKDVLKGDKGDSAYEIAVKNGFIGTEEEWIESLNNYDNLLNKPQINDVELTGNKSFEDLGSKPLTNMEIEAFINNITF